MDRGRFIRVLLVGVVGSMLNHGLATALPPQHHEHPSSVAVRSQPVQLAGRVVAVRRVTRVVTIRTAAGGVRSISIAPDATVRAHGATGLNAIRSGVDVEIESVSRGGGMPMAHLVTVR